MPPSFERELSCAAPSQSSAAATVASMPGSRSSACACLAAIRLRGHGEREIVAHLACPVQQRINAWIHISIESIVSRMLTCECGLDHRSHCGVTTRDRRLPWSGHGFDAAARAVSIAENVPERRLHIDEIDKDRCMSEPIAEHLTSPLPNGQRSSAATTAEPPWALLVGRRGRSRVHSFSVRCCSARDGQLASPSSPHSWRSCDAFASRRSRSPPPVRCWPSARRDPPP